jgi:membrane protease YdiL (CAAX protease family)
MDSLLNEQKIMAESEPSFDPPADGAITPHSPDLQRTPDQFGAPTPGFQPEWTVSERSLVQSPRWPHPNFGWSLLWCVMFVFVTQVPGLIVAVAIVVGIALLAPDMLPTETLKNQNTLLKSQAMSLALAVAVFITEILTITLSWLVIRLVVGRDWKRQLALRRPGLAHTLLVLAGFPAMWLLGNLSYYVLRHYLRVPGFFMEDAMTLFARWPLGFTILVIGLGPGIGEELWCRGFLGRGLVGNYGVVFGVVAASFFFGLLHLDPCQGGMAMVLGLWLHFVYLTTRSLLLPMLLHFLNNSLSVSVSVLASGLSEAQALDSDPQSVPVPLCLATLFLLAGVAYALYQSRTRLAVKSPEQIFLWHPPFEGVECPPADSGMRVVNPPPSLAAVALVVCGFLLFALTCIAWIYQEFSYGG